MSKPIRHLTTKLNAARKVTWCSYCLLLVSLWVGGLLSATPVSLLVLACIPLLLLLPGLYRENFKSLAMLSFVAILYFIPLMVNLWEPDASTIDILSLALVCILFTAAMLFSRWTQYQRAGLGAD